MFEPTIANISLVLGVAFVGLGVLFAMLVADERRRRRRAVPAHGVVVSVDTSQGRLEPTVRFRTTDGTEITAACSQGRHTWRRDYYPGLEIGLRYDPSKPSWILVDGHTNQTPFFAVASVLTILIGVGLLTLRFAVAG
jgi:hypothetical protein